MFGFAKNALGDIDPDEMATLKATAAKWLKADVQELERAIGANVLMEMEYDSQDQKDQSADRGSPRNGL